MKLLIVEGSRGVGKSTVTKRLRESLSHTTLINPTGFHQDSEEGLEKITSYYISWLNLLRQMDNIKDHIIILDRFFLSEMVYSQLYKSYDFKPIYDALLLALDVLDDVTYVYLTIEDKEELKNRLMRDKVPFGKAEESVAETLSQQKIYDSIFEDISMNKRIKAIKIDTTGRDSESIKDEIIRIIGGK